MRLKDMPKSRNVIHAPQTTMPGRENRRDRPQHIFQSKELKEALNDVSTQFRDKISGRKGKSNQERLGEWEGRKRDAKVNRDNRYQP